MENIFWIALASSLMAAAVTSIGIYVIRRFESWGRRNTIYFICFAAGVLIGSSILNAPFTQETNFMRVWLIKRSGGLTISRFITWLPNLEANGRTD